MRWKRLVIILILIALVIVLVGCRWDEKRREGEATSLPAQCITYYYDETHDVSIWTFQLGNSTHSGRAIAVLPGKYVKNPEMREFIIEGKEGVKP